MPIVRDFIYDLDDDSGYEGLRPTWFANANPTSGVGLAHDVLEHFLSQEGPISGELEATGAALALRWEQGWASRHTALTEDDAMANAVFQIICDIVRDGYALPALKRSRRMPEGCRWADDVILTAVDRAVELVKREFADDEANTQAAAQCVTPAMQETLVSWLRSGYRKTLKRYEGSDLHTVGMYFYEHVASRAEELLRSEFLRIGDRIRVSLHPRKCELGIRVNGRCAYAAGYL